MDYKELNLIQKERMKQISQVQHEFELQNPEFLDEILGNLPSVRIHDEIKEKEADISELKKTLASYDQFSTDTDEFLKKLKFLILRIKEKNPRWVGLNYYKVKQLTNIHKFCLISGEGGVGKSYFIKTVQEELEKLKIPHLCIYGKFEKDLSQINMETIIRDSGSGFVFIVDAINEMKEEGQKELLTHLKELIQIRSIRVIITYRNNSIDPSILESYKQLACAEHRFTGVSFEGALEGMIKSAVPDVYKYEDVLYSNNAFFLGMLSKILTDKKLVEETENSIASVTYILEKYVKKIAQDVCKGISKYKPNDVWQAIKSITKWMYIHGEKEIGINTIYDHLKINSECLDLILQTGIIDEISYKESTYYYFPIETLTDFLLARHLFEDIEKCSHIELVNLISERTSRFHGIQEIVIILLFDKFSPDFECIRSILEKTELIYYFSMDILLKIRFDPDQIGKFLKVFNQFNCDGMLSVFGGYVDKPFNCINFLNDYYLNEDNQLRKLSDSLLCLMSHQRVVNRLKNILYFITIEPNHKKRLNEAFYFAQWCSASPRKRIRRLATKLLYELVQINPDYKNLLIAEYQQIVDPYIKESIIYVLANYHEQNQEISEFFERVKTDELILTSKSIKRISQYLNDDYGYINWTRANLYKRIKNASISPFLDQLLFKYELMNKDTLPFKYFGDNRIKFFPHFLDVSKENIMDFNNSLNEKYNCVRRGRCQGLSSFEKHVLKSVKKKEDFPKLDKIFFFHSYEDVLQRWLATYRLSNKTEDYWQTNGDSLETLLSKCIDIATGEYYGSLMCNFYTDRFGSYNNIQNCIGFEVYDPIEFGEEMNINTPIPRFQNLVSKLGDMIVNRMDVPSIKNIDWANDTENNRKNLLSLIKPITNKGIEWILLGGKVSLGYELQWRDSYNIWCSTNSLETITDHVNARDLTIDLREYDFNIKKYKLNKECPWLCKVVGSIDHGNDLFDDTSIVLPPSELISRLDLHFCSSKMAWTDSNGELVIVCNNNKHSFTRDPISSTIFIKKKKLDNYLKKYSMKYFAYTERYVPETKFLNDTSLHFEIRNGNVIKEIMNDGGSFCREKSETINCENCSLNHKLKEDEEVALLKVDDILNALIEKKEE